ncbi:hypothetical protein BSU04_35160 [Caballeronia sordidicola]|uniref:Uncharacterized protein n=1 Tax=Caballeronia sordidicola TaxID=196367 RepID=A0A226WRH7_CABSO|nr:hypothetical protein BSU04_35160 [Caballeronia sordidicola]
MQAHRNVLLDEHFTEARRAVWLSTKRGATPVRDAADARSSRTKAR